MLKIYARDIKWDTDDASCGDYEPLPTDVMMLCEEAIADKLSDEYGWLVESFSIEIVSEPR